jgi:hypothetical protein
VEFQQDGIYLPPKKRVVSAKKGIFHLPRIVIFEQNKVLVSFTSQKTGEFQANREIFNLPRIVEFE